MIGHTLPHKDGTLSHVGISKTTELASDLNKNFEDKAFMSLDGLFRPAQITPTDNKLSGYPSPVNDGNIKNRSKKS